MQVTKEGRLQNNFGEVLKVSAHGSQGDGTIKVKLISGPKEGKIRSYNAHELKRVGTAKNVRRVLSWRQGVVVPEVDARETAGGHRLGASRAMTSAKVVRGAEQ